jgi:diguanylate cyclase (GGDEF)-like protein
MKPKILVVDDVPANLVAMRHLLAKTEAEVIEAASGNEALALCLDNEFALILLDVNMPEMDGFEVAALIGEIDALRDTPIIFVTAAYADDLHRLKGYSNGAVDYIAKPVNDVILQSKVRIFLDLFRARTMLEDALAELHRRNEQLTVEVEERRRAEERVLHQATHDSLTGLPNRTLFHDRLHSAIQRSTRQLGRFALAFIDIDGFKGVNDRYGHPAGDALLQAIALRMQGRLRANDTVARLGGDEFAVILEGVDKAEVALELGQQLCDAIAQPYDLEVRDFRVPAQIGASIGVALFELDDHADADERLLNSADEAMYEAKRGGKNRVLLAAANTALL